MNLLQGEIIPNALGQNMKDYSIYALNRAGFVKTGQILHSASCPVRLLSAGRWCWDGHPCRGTVFLLLFSTQTSRSWALVPTLRFCCPKSLYRYPTWVSASLPSSLVQHLKCFGNSHWFILLPETGAWDLPFTHGAWPWRAVNRHGALLSGEGLQLSVSWGPPLVVPFWTECCLKVWNDGWARVQPC